MPKNLNKSLPDSKQMSDLTRQKVSTIKTAIKNKTKYIKNVAETILKTNKEPFTTNNKKRKAKVKITTILKKNKEISYIIASVFLLFSFSIITSSINKQERIKANAERIKIEEERQAQERKAEEEAKLIEKQRDYFININEDYDFNCFFVRIFF